jgi:putative addiction module CopG family antidote
MNLNLPPALQRFVDEQVALGRYADAADVVRTAVRRLEAQSRLAETQAQAAEFVNLGGLADGDIMALCFIVMMEAAKSAREDLKAIMDGVKAINAAKQAYRELIDQVQRDVAANPRCPPECDRLDLSRGLSSERAYHRAALPVLDPDAPGGVRLDRVDLHPGKLSNTADLRAVLDDVKGQLDSLSELGEMESLRLQMAMDRLSKLMSTLSNLLKKSSDTAAGIIQNIK